MLIRLHGRNFHSMKGDFELSMVAAESRREQDRDRGVVIAPIDGLDEPLRILRTAAIYGPNASGKSTVLQACGALNWLVARSSAEANPDSGVRAYEPFLFDPESREAPVALGCDIVHNKSVLNYSLEFGRGAIHQERLVEYTAGEERVLIDRCGEDPIGGELVKKSKANRALVTDMQPNVGVLAKLAQHGSKFGGRGSVVPYFRSLRRATIAVDFTAIASSLWELESHEPWMKRFADDEKYQSWIMSNLMTAADVGICNVVTRVEDGPDFGRQDGNRDGSEALSRRVFVSFVHEGSERHPVEFRYESAGTRKLFHAAPVLWSLANEDVTFFVDELSASLHPRLLDQVIRSVNALPPDAARSQLIFTTHDTGLMEGRDELPPALRRDQVYFTRKDREGASELYPLTEFKEQARTVHNIRKRYMAGLYGALPIVKRLSLS